MDIQVYIEECRTEISAIERSREFWSKHIAFLKQNGVQPTAEDAEGVRKQIEGLDASSLWLKQHIAEIENSQNASRS